MTPALALALAVHATLGHAYTMVPRWGAAVAVLSHPPTVVIQGGKTDPLGQQSYTSAPNSGDTILLPLTASFPASNPPYSQLPNGPAYAWHCIAPLFKQGEEWTLLSFGGDGGWLSPIGDAHSAYLLTLNPTAGTINYTQPAEGWGNQPTRRIRHSCAAPVSGGKVYITGGQRTDYSEAYAQTFVFDPTSMTFSPLAPLPMAIYDHSSVLLPNGTLVVMGGVRSQSGSTALQALDTVFTLDTTSSSATWQTVSVPVPPRARRGASASLNPDGSVFVFGGLDDERNALNDGWLLDPQYLSWTQTFDGGQGVAGSYDHVAAAGGGGQVIVFGGYGQSAPVAPNTIIINSRVVPVGAQGSGSGTSYTSGASTGSGTGSGTGAGSGTESGTGGDSSGDSSMDSATGSNTASGSNNSGTGTLPEYTPSSITGNSPNAGMGTGVGAPSPTSTGPSLPMAASSVAPLTLGLTVGLIGGGLLLGFVFLMFWCCLRRRRSKRGEEERRDLVHGDPEKGTWGRSRVLQPSRDSDNRGPQRHKSLLQRLGTKIWRRPAYVPLGGEQCRESTIFPTATRDHFEPQPPLPFQEGHLPSTPRLYNPDDMVFGNQRDLGVRGVSGCLSGGQRGTSSVAAAAVGAMSGFAARRASYKTPQTPELSRITPFPYDERRSADVVIGSETSKGSDELHIHLSDAYDADESSSGHRVGARPLPPYPLQATTAYAYPPLSTTSSLSSAPSVASDAYTSEASRGVPAIAKVIGAGAGLAGVAAARTSSRRLPGKKDSAPWEAWDPKSDTESSAYHYPLGPKIGTTVYDPSGKRLDSAVHARTYSDPFADTDVDAPLLPAKNNFGFPNPPQSLPHLTEAPPQVRAKPHPISVKTVPSARDTSQEADITSARFGPRPMLTSPPPLPPKYLAPVAELGTEGAGRRSAVGSVRSAASHSSVFGALANRDLDLSFDFVQPAVVPSPSPSPSRPPSPSPYSSLSPHESPSPSGAEITSYFEIPVISRPNVEDGWNGVLQGAAGPLTAFSKLYNPRNVSGRSDKGLPPRPESHELPPCPASPELPPRPASPVVGARPFPSVGSPPLESPPAVTAPLRVRTRSRPSTAELPEDMVTSEITRSGVPSDSDELDELDLSLEDTSLEVRVSSSPVGDTSSVGDTLSLPSSPFASRPQPSTPSRSSTIPVPRAYTAPSTPTRSVREGSLASFANQSSLRPGQEGFVSTMVSSINLLDTPESAPRAHP
ncbi:hypothetical protein CspeluHIS016_0105290 [Cutaneotrichosporon spelunceum]|uniref:Galactose oxidase n=1 Tax=Cutaneotrichosporon spelunceum TaxID=1672016 RepID=A0AAD3TNR7_9TREE|nr:hypothetical protein CspeluHIS016_0105290 [Cutaneotrichosporon spelunceum]